MIVEKGYQGGTDYITAVSANRKPQNGVLTSNDKGKIIDILRAALFAQKFVGWETQL